eukprot:gb/GFBE01000499.1/.p1 GENE.gb/GFBE01000499.1/~~gb/GFBE01000499.1/.p1  ORF type:complete len:315 (+),score=71.95 gb/GFBE01000499.1/:1-945(+)
MAKELDITEGTDTTAEAQPHKGLPRRTSSTMSTSGRQHKLQRSVTSSLGSHSSVSAGKAHASKRMTMGMTLRSLSVQDRKTCNDLERHEEEDEEKDEEENEEEQDREEEEKDNEKGEKQEKVDGEEKQEEEITEKKDEESQAVYRTFEAEDVVAAHGEALVTDFEQYTSEDLVTHAEPIAPITLADLFSAELLASVATAGASEWNTRNRSGRAPNAVHSTAMPCVRTAGGSVQFGSRGNFSFAGDFPAASSSLARPWTAPNAAPLAAHTLVHLNEVYSPRCPRNRRLHRPLSTERRGGRGSRAPRSVRVDEFHL